MNDSFPAPRWRPRLPVPIRVVLVTLGLFVPCDVAFGEPMPRSHIVVVTPRGADLLVPARRRLVGELTAAGFDVSTLEGRDLDENPSADDEEPFATVTLAIVGKRASAEVSVMDRSTHKPVVRHLGDEQASDVLAIHAAELLRASCLDLAIQGGTDVPADVAQWIGPLPAPTEPAPSTIPTLPDPKLSATFAPLNNPDRELPPDDAPPAPRTRPRLPPSVPLVLPKHSVWVGLGGVVQGSLGGLPAAFGPVLDVRFRTPFEWLDVDARVAAPVATAAFGDRTGQTVGSATVRHGQADVSVQFRAWTDHDPIRPSLGAGIGAHLVDVDGRGSPGHAGLHNDAVSCTPTATADVELRLHERIRAFAAISTVFTLPEPAILFADTQVAHAGEPLILGSVTIAVRI